MIKKGKLKFFNFEKGYGFITPDDGSREVFIHSNDAGGLKPFLLPTAIVHYRLEQTSRGPKAFEIEVQKRFETWYLPKPCSHTIAVKDHQSGIIAVFNQYEDVEAWINRRRISNDDQQT